MLTAAMERGLPILRDYLDRIGFVRIYKFIVTPGLYHTSPNVLSWRNLERAADLASYVTGDTAALGLAACLMLKVSIHRDALPASDREIAERLVDAGLLVRSGGALEMGAYQLISAQDLPLLIDSRINYPGAAAPQVYFGSDSLRLASHVDTSGISRTDPVIDLGTGSGMIGLFLARYSDRVTLTDISPRALELAHANRLLHRMTGRAAIREEGYEATFARHERYHTVTFNPPFLPIPEGLDAPVFARGAGRDGLDHCRLLLENLDHLLLPGGTAYLVANLLGTAEGPFFTEELRRHADRRGLGIEIFIDPASPLVAGAPVFEALGAFLHRENPAIARAECQRRMEELQLQTLGATHAYLSIVIIREGARPGPSLRVFHWRGPPIQSPLASGAVDSPDASSDASPDRGGAP